MKNIRLQKNKGFVILFAMLISTIILLIAAGIFNVVQKEVVLSSYARESQRAFYSADSALECALYADIHGIGSTNPYTPFRIVPAPEVNDQNFDCGNNIVTSSYTGGATANYDHSFVFRYRNASADDTSCAYVLVEKELKGTANPNDDLNATEVRITAVGFNVCTDTLGAFNNTLEIPDFNDPTLLERRLSLTYIQ